MSRLRDLITDRLPEDDRTGPRLQTRQASAITPKEIVWI